MAGFKVGRGSGPEGWTRDEKGRVLAKRLEPGARALIDRMESSGRLRNRSLFREVERVPVEKVDQLFRNTF
jgi:hypothetical protein